MRRLTRGRLARTLASILIGVFAYPTLIGWSLALPVSAQIMTETELEFVAVLPFTNFTEVQPDLLGDKASAAVHQALLDTQAYDVRSLEDTQQKMDDLALRTPLDEAGFARLGEALGVDGIVFGEIRAAGVRRITRTAQGEMTLMVAVFDVPSRTIRAGTIATAHSSPAMGEVSEDALIDEALNQVTFQAIKEIQSYRPITGMVQWADEKDVTISAGETQGVREEMKFVVMREGQRVGIISITKPLRAASDGRIIEGHARTGDKIRQIIEIPARGTAVEIPGVKAEKKRSKSKLWLALGLAFLLYLFTQSRGGKSSPYGFTTAAISNPLDSGVETTWENEFTFVDDEIFYSRFSTFSAVRLHWPGASAKNVAGYEIWRDGELLWFEAEETAADRTITFPTIHSRLEVTITATASGIINVTLSLPGPEESSGGSPPQVAERSGEGTSTMFYNLRGDFYNETSLYNEGDTVTVYIGPVAGSRHTFQVRRVIAQPETQPDGTVSYVFTAGAPISKAKVVTFVPPLDLEFPANNEPVSDATAVDLGFHGAEGANDYILQVSRDSLFAPSAT
ncbi:MAG: hypothetical protein GTO55_08645, partial [Armatimonadetes bacterium]|nr:hypothetical protein [Armatimonadota bacterium]NIM24314.1 hypothetical protein [Armatimonadota bacterium]NIM68183.1 hypothetical protein [Armatimonadota bacterium]NIM76643.1 hypothetical protein [Armatimonadota bacterium]NIN06388.1 hypothetical protein [Armatimonadota bacterium]